MRQYPSGLELLVEQTTPMKHWPVYIHLSAIIAALDMIEDNHDYQLLRYSEIQP
jgi:hypothetical protein